MSKDFLRRRARPIFSLALVAASAQQEVCVSVLHVIRVDNRAPPITFASKKALPSNNLVRSGALTLIVRCCCCCPLDERWYMHGLLRLKRTKSGNRKSKSWLLHVGSTVTSRLHSGSMGKIVSGAVHAYHRARIEPIIYICKHSDFICSNIEHTCTFANLAY